MRARQRATTWMTGAWVAVALFALPAPSAAEIFRVFLKNGTALGAEAITLNGTPVQPASRYRVTVNSFLADGGDGFAVLQQGEGRLGGAVDTDAFEAYLQANPAGVAPGAQNRIKRLP